MSKKAQILWMDLEMTGLNPVEDRILEVGAIATDWQFKEVATYEGIVKVDDEIIEKRMVGDFWKKYKKVKNELVKQNTTGESIDKIEKQLIKFVKSNFDLGDPIYLAGNSIHQDRKFIDREWPELSKMLHYRMLDVSAWKLVFENRFCTKLKKPEAHRALADIEGSIEELKTYIDSIKLS